jgi:hypothetical protein
VKHGKGVLNTPKVHSVFLSLSLFAEILLGFASHFFAFVILSVVEIRATRGSNVAQRHLGSQAKKFDSASLHSG